MDKQSKKDMGAAYKEKKKTGGIYAIRNSVTGKALIGAAPDMEGFRNRFSFSQATGSCVQPRLEADWKKFGGQAFVLEIKETIEKKKDQTDREFADDLATLKDLWLEKSDPLSFY
ncbi:MAG: GIY-YIG nuclease family protein [Eubacteriales bacterium]